MKNKQLALCVLAALSLPLAGVLQAEEGKAPDTTPQQEDATPAYLGVVVGPVPQAVQAQLPQDVADNQGLLVMRVVPDSPAAKAGLKRHDVLLAFEGKQLISPKDLIDSVRNTKGGQEAKVQILRHGKVSDIQVTMETLGIPQHARQGPRRMMPAPHLRPAPDNRGEVIVEKEFQAMSVNKLPDGSYKAAIEFLDRDGNMKKFEFQGSKEELREQVKKEKDLPGPQKQQLLNALGGRMPAFSMPDFPDFPGFEEFERELFAPPPWARPYRPSFWD